MEFARWLYIFQRMVHINEDIDRPAGLPGWGQCRARGPTEHVRAVAGDKSMGEDFLPVDRLGDRSRPPLDRRGRRRAPLKRAEVVVRAHSRAGDRRYVDVPNKGEVVSSPEKANAVIQVPFSDTIVYNMNNFTVAC